MHVKQDVKNRTYMAVARYLLSTLLYMLVPKCALSQFANWDPSLETGINGTISVCKLGSIEK